MQAVAHHRRFQEVEPVGSEQLREHVRQRRSDERAHSLEGWRGDAEIAHRAIDRYRDSWQRVDQRAVEIEQEVPDQFAAPSSANATSAF
jgi:hypothetical protein